MLKLEEGLGLMLFLCVVWYQEQVITYRFTLDLYKTKIS